jgi:VCBS repeat-containing protein
VRAGKRKKCVSNSFGASTTSIPAAGTYRVKLPPNAAALKAYNKGKSQRVKVTLTFQPAAGGAPVVTTVTVTVKGKKKHKR